MSKIKVLPCGLGKLGAPIVQALLKDERFSVLPYALEGDGNVDKTKTIDDHWMRLIKPDRWEAELQIIKSVYPELLIIEATCPAAVNSNVETFCRLNLPSLICTTGGDQTKLVKTINESSVPAIIAPNLAYSIVWLLESLAKGAEMAPDLLADWTVKKIESHQAWKKDFSGTGREFGDRVFKPLGALDIPTAEYTKITHQGLENLVETLNTPGSQNIALRGEAAQLFWGVPEEFLDGHGHHQYFLTSPDGLIEIGISHKINGRLPYIPGALKALTALDQARIAGITGALYMRDAIFNDR